VTEVRKGRRKQLNEGGSVEKLGTWPYLLKVKRSGRFCLEGEKGFETGWLRGKRLRRVEDWEVELRFQVRGRESTWRDGDACGKHITPITRKKEKVGGWKNKNQGGRGLEKRRIRSFCY